MISRLPTAGKLRAVIDADAAFVSLPPWPYRGEVFAQGEWWEALILHESSGNPNARHYDRAPDAKPGGSDTAGKDDGNFEDDASYGLCQIEGKTARGLFPLALGRVDFSFLYRPLGNMADGLSVILEELKASAGSVEGALARYNGGEWGARLNAQRQLNNQVYVDFIFAAAVRVQADRRAA